MNESFSTAKQKRSVRKYPGQAVFLLSAHHDFGNRIQNLVMATTASRGAMGNFLHLVKGLQHVIKMINLMKRFLNVTIRNLLAVTNHFIFFHQNPPPYVN